MTVFKPRLRWTLFLLLCLAGIFNAMDRPIIAILKPDMAADFDWDDQDFGNLAFLTQMAAAFSFLFTGWLVDKLGLIRGTIAGVTTWSLAAISHGWAMSTSQVVAARVGLGVTEAIQTPLIIKALAVLFPPNRRSFAFGTGQAIGGLGSISLPFLIPILAAWVGWRGALIFGGLAGFVILAIWLLLARGSALAAETEKAEPRLSETSSEYGAVLADRRTWAIVIAKALSDSTFWMMVFWLPDFYRKTYGLTAKELAIPLALAALLGGVGSLTSGLVSTRLLESGWSVNRTRKTVMFVSALMVLPLPFLLQIQSFWVVAVLVGVVMAGHAGFSLSIFSMITDIVPRAKVGRVTAFGAFMGNMGGALIQLVTGAVLTAQLGFGLLFIFGAATYLVALAWLQLMLPTLRRYEE
ncbi:MFS transporter [Novosphingobium sp.]|jgi:ACS family hexuronate transporter-like MFS transporter|uniref:MFS transporter n=1 Tax=Novosphingobium sp. TaxID=1874826 RepID=UPI0022C9E9D7|nr:MFS transporter [Novosphingobium sp.]MCZ8017257.1 MFS transporter [Novosphingobium sp.]MCZ8034220.1 MFS transporter [Novosphingobium sp.]MCZ8051575.1 MFS transporter [Novosphingobium sp.]MCZ8059921.1 MFS transporter [Novosphingobium sp.]MCZ8231759.1 MFS transporter [Novosphingobium sp.]